MWYRLVGSSLEVYDVKSKDDEPLYVVAEAPIAVHEVKGVTKISPVNFRVTILSGDGGLNLFAADEADGKGWVDALTKASEWDQLKSTRKVRNACESERASVFACMCVHATCLVCGLAGRHGWPFFCGLFLTGEEERADEKKSV